MNSKLSLLNDLQLKAFHDDLKEQERKLRWWNIFKPILIYEMIKDVELEMLVRKFSNHS